MEMQHTPVKSGYGKKNLWQWIAVYVVVGGILYYSVYLIAIARK